MGTGKNRSCLARIAVAAVLCFGTAVAANAKVINITYSGVVSRGYDFSGYFGQPNTDLAGFHYSDVYTIDDSKGFSFRTPPLYSELIGGFKYIFPVDSPVSEVFTINGNSVYNDGHSRGQAYQSTLNSGRAQIVDMASQYAASDLQESETYSIESIVSQIHPFTPSYDYLDPPTYDLRSGDTSGGYWQTFVYIQNVGYASRAYADLTPLAVSTDVPEPTAWVLLIGGFGVLGLALRGRRGELNQV